MTPSIEGRRAHRAWSCWLVLTAVLLAACGPTRTTEDTGADADAATDTGLDIVHYDVPEDESGAECVTDDDCVGNPAGPRCDRGPQICRQCLPNPNTCSAGEYCDSTYHCVSGCAADVDCLASSADGGTPDSGDAGASTRCLVAEHRCVACLGDLDCGGDLICRNNQCTMGCSATRPCPSGSDCCDGACINLLDDPAHCGSCAHACDTGNACCGGICFDVNNDPRHCGTCTTRCMAQYATSGCATGACTVASCVPGHGDCDGDPSNGCELPLTGDVNHCGSCSTVCPNGPNSTAACISGICSNNCAPGFLHCSTNVADGCEVNPVNDPLNCGACGHVCTGNHATGGCSAGACTIASCDPGYRDCNGNAADGCEVALDTDPYNCGACLNLCPSGPFAAPACTGGACSIRCTAGHDNCDSNPGNGCETDLTNDAANCSACGMACPARPNSTSLCRSGACSLACAIGFRDCNAVATDGCEVDTRSSVTNCGACGTTCSVANASATCTGGACGIGTCNAGFANCDGNTTNGCETPTNNDPLNCGACFRSCPGVPFATATCSSGTCGFTCMAGRGDCDGNAANGCETNLATDATHCGSCATACTGAANATPACVGSSCSFTCSGSFRNCDGMAGNGCETDVSASALNCGACGTRCTLANATASCSAGACTIASCNAGFGDCDGIASNGCERDLRSDTNNCGSCFRICPSGANATGTCAAGACGVRCATGYGDCNGMASDGCEANFATDPTHCGSCTTACSNPPNAIGTCSASTCGLICTTGFRDCNGTRTDGCEINVRTDPRNCGSCGNTCTTPNATPACSSGGCAIGACNANYLDCNGAPSDGCEVRVDNDSSNCGGCGNVCTGGTTCVSGSCILVNPFPSTGAEGAFNPSVNTVIPAGVHNYTTINIPAGVTVTVSGNGVLDLRATGNVTIAGIIDVSGGNGGAGVRGTGGGGGGTTAIRTTAATATPGGAGTGGMAPAGANATGCGLNALGGTYGGGSGTQGTGAIGGGGGGGPAGGAGGLIGGMCIAGSGGGGATAGAGGQSGGPPYDGNPGQTGMDACGGIVAGGGGGSIGMMAVMDLAIMSTLIPGSGGGGGSASYGTGGSAAMGGGGGGGGAVRIASPTSITVTGTIRADGGVGGAGSAGTATCTTTDAGSGGGGGSGGAIYLASPTVNVSGTLSAVGGIGGLRGTNASGGDGGAGGLGRIRLSVSAATCTLGGTFNPPLRSGCGLTNGPGLTYIAGYPR